MGAIQVLTSVVFVAAYVCIAIENKLGVSKAGVACVAGVVMWGIIVAGHGSADEHMHQVLVDIFEIFMFLFAAMMLVRVLATHHFFELIRQKLARRGLNDRSQFLALMPLTFFLSAVLDNLTITIVMVEICLRFFRDNNRLLAIAGVVITANAGGAWSPVGDVTTIMLWNEGKFPAWQIALEGIVPSLAIGAVATLLLWRKLDHDTPDILEDEVKLTPTDWLINITTLASFALPLAANLIGLPPFMGLLFGLGVWIMLHVVWRPNGVESTLEHDIKRVLAGIDAPALLFFVGILLAVGALDATGVLHSISALLLGEEQTYGRVVAGMVGLGLVSAIVDNIPLTALAMDMVTLSDPRVWVLLAITVGTGGSALVTGSAAGVVAMGLEPKLTFGAYLRIATLPAVVSYTAGIGVWYLMFA